MNPLAGEVWLVNLDPTIGDEIKKVRPVVVVSRDTIGVLALRVVVPVTAWQDRFRVCSINGVLRIILYGTQTLSERSDR